MFPAEIYVARRKRLKSQITSGVILLMGNEESPRNSGDNHYPFRQDSSFLYYFGLDSAGLAAALDVDEGREIVFGDDPTVDEVIWVGPQEILQERCLRVGVTEIAEPGQLAELVSKAAGQGRPIHFLPAYRSDVAVKLGGLLKMTPGQLSSHVSAALIRAVVAQRSIKSAEEIEQIEIALDVTHDMHIGAMKMTRPGVVESEVAGAVEGIALARGCRLAFGTIFSIHGETLHNPHHGNVMKAGDMVVHDSGAESRLHYAGDITRTLPVGGAFSQKQREMYAIVLQAQKCALEAIQSGVEFRHVHYLASKGLVSGLKELGLITGDVEEATGAGAHTLFFQCGVGHMMGLDVHDMEGLGEDYVGYTETIKRNRDFGWRSLRLGKALEAGHVVTVEPGLYFIPALIDRWKAQRKCSSFINYEQVEKYRDFGGIRLEDDVLVVDAGYRLLGKRTPKTIDEVETMTSA